jgi:hypothetical protein
MTAEKSCFLCSFNLETLSLEERERHVNLCLDQLEKTKARAPGNAPFPSAKSSEKIKAPANRREISKSASSRDHSSKTKKKDGLCKRNNEELFEDDPYIIVAEKRKNPYVGSLNSLGACEVSSKPKRERRSYSVVKRELRDVEAQLRRLERRKILLERELCSASLVIRPSQEPLPPADEVISRIFSAGNRSTGSVSVRDGDGVSDTDDVVIHLRAAADSQLWRAAAAGGALPATAPGRSSSFAPSISSPQSKFYRRILEKKTGVEGVYEGSDEESVDNPATGEDVLSPEIVDLVASDFGSTLTQSSVDIGDPNEIPDYEQMSLEELQAEMDANGLKHRSRAVMVNALRSIWLQLHGGIADLGKTSRNETLAQSVHAAAMAAKQPMPSLSGMENAPVELSRASVVHAIKCCSQLHEDILCLQRVRIERILAALDITGIAVGGGDGARRNLQILLDELGISH